MMTRPRHILLGLMLTICCSQGVEYMLPMLEGREQLSVVAGERGGSCEVQSISKVNVKTYESYHLGMEGKFKNKGTGIVNNTVTIKASNVQIYTSTGPNVYSPLPVSALGTKYIVSCCNLPTIRNHSSSIVIITHSYKADVNITFRLEGNVNYDNRIYTDGDTLTVSLQEYQTLKIFSDWDLTGTVVRSTQTVAVFIVTNDRSFPEWLRASAQLLPVHLYGQEYVVAVDDSPILYQLEIVSEASDTRITFNDGSTVTMDESGIFRQNITSNNTVLYFSSSKPVMTMLCRLDMYGTGAWKRDNFLAIRPVSFYTKETSVSTNTLHTLKILTDKPASDTTMRINSTERPILEWEEIPGSRYKVGTAVTSYDWSTVSVISSTSFTVLLFASGFMFTGGYNISQPTGGIGEEYIILNLRFYVSVSAVAGKTGGWCEVQSISKVGFFHGISILRVSGFVKKRTGIENNTVLVKANNVHIYHSFRKFSPLPISALGTKYIVSSCLPSDKSDFSLVLVIATHSHKTDVNITFRLEGNVNYDNKFYTDGDNLTVSLQEYQTLTIFSDWDLTGTVVRSTQIVAVFSALNLFKPFNKPRLVTQLLPVHLYGQEYVVAVDDYPDLYHLQIVSEASNTRITFNDGSTVSMDESGIFKQNITSNSTLYFSSSRPVMTMLCRLNNTVVLQPVSLYTKQTSVILGYKTDTVKILTEKQASDTTLKIGSTKSPLLEWAEIPGSRYKVGTAVPPYDWRIASITSNTSFTVLMFDQDNMYTAFNIYYVYTGDSNSSQPTREIDCAPLNSETSRVLVDIRSGR